MIACVYITYYLIPIYKWTGWSGYSKQNKYPKLLSASICVFSAKSPEAHQSPQLGWLALELLCCSSHPKDLVFEDRQTTPKEWRRASEWSNLGEERNACIGVVSVFVQVDVLFMRSKRPFSDVIVGNHLTQLDECWPTYLLRHFMERNHEISESKPMAEKQQKRPNDCSRGGTHAVHSHDFSSSEHDLRYLKASIWLSHLMQFIPWFSASEPCQIAAKDHVITRHSMPMPNLTRTLGRFQTHWANHRPTSRGSPMQSISKSMSAIETSQ